VITVADDDQPEHGYKWWIRYVIVPLIGGGGVVAVIVALIVSGVWKPSTERQITAPQSPASPPEVAQTKPSATKEILVDFAHVETHKAPGMTVAAHPELRKYRIFVDHLVPKGSELVLINNRAVYQGDAVQPTTSQNLLTQIGTGNVPASFTLRFSKPLDGVTFTRPALYPATNSGITHPAWSAHALDAAGRELSAQRESIIRSFEDVPSRSYTLTAPGFDGIVALRFDSDPRLDGRPFAAFSAILIERLTLGPRGK
jgi:hypothetical protein